MSRQRRAARPIAIAFLVCALGITGGDAGADDTSASPDWNPPIVPAPEPFSLNSYDAIDVVALLRRVRFLQH